MFWPGEAHGLFPRGHTGSHTTAWLHVTAQQLAHGAALMDGQEAAVLTAGGRGVGDGGAEGP